MIKICLFISILLLSINIDAQDIIVKKDGETISSRILEVNVYDVKYKRYSNLNGPIYTINKSELLSINYENGDRDCFSDIKLLDEIGNSSLENKQIVVNPDDNNTKVLSRINSIPENGDKKKNRTTKASIVSAFMGITDESILSSKEVELSFSRDFIELGLMKGETVYGIILKNKTNNILYVDKACCFIIDKDNNAFQFYNPNDISTTKGHSIGAGLSLASISSLFKIGGVAGTIINGINVNGGFSNYTTITEKDQQILVIPPRGNVCIAKGLKIPLFFVQKNLLRMGECKSFDYSDSPITWSYFITYSFRKDFNTFSTLDIKAYCKYLYGHMGQPIIGGNLVESPMLIYPEQVYTNFNCSDSEKTKYNTHIPNR